MTDIDIDTARRMVDLFQQAADAAPLRQVRREMIARRNEWDRALRDLEYTEGEGVIELAGAVARYMKVLGGRNGDWCVVLKHTANSSLMLEDPDDPRPSYRSFHDEASPVVVQR